MPKQAKFKMGGGKGTLEKNYKNEVCTIIKV